MSWTELADLLFTPIRWTKVLLLGDLDQQTLSSLAGLIALYLLSSVVIVVALAAVGFLLFRILLEVELALGRVWAWSVCATDVSTIRKAAERWLVLSSVLTQARSLTGVGVGVPSDPAPRLRGSTPTPHRLLRWLVRASLSVPVIGVVRAVWSWAKTPLGIYVAAGSLWVIGSPWLHDASQLQTAVWRAVASPTGLAALAVLLAAATVGLDHGLTARTRGRNTFLRERAATAEAGLATMRMTCNDVLTSIDEVVDHRVRYFPQALSSAVEGATHEAYVLLDREVTWHAQGGRKSYLRSDESWSWWRFGPEGDARSRRGVGDPAEQLVGAVDRLRGALPEGDLYFTAWRQAPRPARRLLSELAFHRRIDRAPLVVSLLALERLERSRLQLQKSVSVEFATAHKDDEDATCASQSCSSALQSQVEREYTDLGSDLWRMYEFRALVRQFARAIDSVHSPRSAVRRAVTRLG